MSGWRPILVLDFDGVLHSYTSGWQGARSIPDLPVPGAMAFLENTVDRFTVKILSSRSHQWGGRGAMKKWLVHHMTGHLLQVPAFRSYRDKFDGDIDYPMCAMEEKAARQIINKIGFPLFKPPATVTLDDRALTFTGTFPQIHEIREFTPWNRKGKT